MGGGGGRKEHLRSLASEGRWDISRCSHLQGEKKKKILDEGFFSRKERREKRENNTKKGVFGKERDETSDKQKNLLIFEWMDRKKDDGPLEPYVGRTLRKKKGNCYYRPIGSARNGAKRRIEEFFNRLGEGGNEPSNYSPRTIRRKKKGAMGGLPSPEGKDL